MPTYQDIVDQLVADAQNIFGSDIYLQPDSQDYQWISAFASMIYDSFLASQAVYNSRGPATALGSGLDVVVGINGIQRQPAVASTCPVVVGGTPGAPITNGVAGDVNGNYWSLPSPTIIGSDGTVTVVATCQTPGAITANPGDINTIITPTLGWSSVTNTVAATVGSPAESDAQLRARQALSTAQASQSILEGLEGALAALSGVTRFKVYENDTSSTDANGVPAHSVCAVVEGGTPSAIAQAIYEHKGPGCGTYGTTTQSITDDYGVVTNINYDELEYVDVDVAITVKQLNGYTTDTTTAIQTAVSTYLSSVAIGTDIYISSIWGAAMTANPNASNPTFSVVSVQACVHGGTLGTTDIPVAFNQAARGNTSYITVTTQ
ncbi:baseplate J/gp47 family protein [Alicyclobacillus suci]|uniref:baseplate J/gp47 family protein n=1 Tax=Alicyclobacillus suci TaxID=2816080 RepID=UPI001A8D3479|nr:baseplate J/gp47 family protein [Alicyclobacillus suci]